MEHDSYLYGFLLASGLQPLYLGNNNPNGNAF